MFKVKNVLGRKDLYYICNPDIHLSLDKNVAASLNLSIEEYKNMISNYDITMMDGETFFTNIDEINELINKLNILLKLKG